MMREEFVAFDGRSASNAKLLLDTVQEFLGVRSKDDLLAVEQAVLEERAPDAIAVIIVDRVDNGIEDDHRATLRDVLGEQNCQTQTFDVSFAEDDERVVSDVRLPGELHLDLSVFHHRQPQRVQQIAGRIGSVERVV